MSAAASPKNLKSKVGAEPRKVAILAGLLLVAAAVFIYNLSSGPSYSNVPPGLTSRTVPTAAAPAITAARQNATHRKLNQRSIERSTIRMRGVTAEAQRGDVDPTLRLDLLQRLQNVQPSASSRNLFDVGAATPQATEATAPKIIPGPLPQTANSDPQTAAATPTVEPIPLKFYGFSSPVSVTGPRRGFFLDGDNILIASEGEMLKGRYRVVNLSARSADVEDVQTKNRQSLPLTPEVQNASF